MSAHDSIGAWICHLDRVYGPRDALLIPGGLIELIGYLISSGTFLGETLRKSEDQRGAEVCWALANTYIWTLSVPGYLRYLKVPEAFLFKYGQDVCHSCHQDPCRCLEKRADDGDILGRFLQQRPDLSFDPRVNLSLATCQSTLSDRYEKVNREKGGAPYILGRLQAEFTELLALANGTDKEIGQRTPERLAGAYSLETADALAWCLTFANQIGVNLAEVANKYYGPGCPVCQKSVCVCSDLEVIRHGHVRQISAFPGTVTVD